MSPEKQRIKLAKLAGFEGVGNYHWNNPEDMVNHTFLESQWRETKANWIAAGGYREC
jgi:hypothetical protein